MPISGILGRTEFRSPLKGKRYRVKPIRGGPLNARKYDDSLLSTNRAAPGPDKDKGLKKSNERLLSALKRILRQLVGVVKRLAKRSLSTGQNTKKQAAVIIKLARSKPSRETLAKIIQVATKISKQGSLLGRDAERALALAKKAEDAVQQAEKGGLGLFG